VCVEGIAAIVGATTPGPDATLILRSDVELRARIELSGQTEGLIRGALPPELLGATLQALIGEALIEREAERLRAEPPSDAAIEVERAALERRAGGASRWAELAAFLEVSDEEVRAAALRRARVSAFLRANLEGSGAVSEAELARVHASGEHPFAGRPLDEVRALLREWLAREGLQRDVGRWVGALRRRSVVRVLAEWPAPAGEPGA
jgi:hypothetical protein